MNRYVPLVLTVALITNRAAATWAGDVPSVEGLLEDTEAGCEESVHPDGEITLTCVPPLWNGVLVVYAHGYVAPQEDLMLPIEELTVDEVFLPSLILEQGFAFATTSYGKNGYAIEQAGGDLNDLVAEFENASGPAAEVLVIGASEGGLVTQMLVEKYPEIYAGGLALCGPVGGAPHQIRYLGDFRAVFDYFFPDVFTFGVEDVPEDAYLSWNTFVQQIEQSIGGDPEATEQLFNVTRAARDPMAPESSVETAVNILFYSIFGTNDLNQTAGGQAYGNLLRWYRGSDNDWALNFGVERVRPDLEAQAYLRRFYSPKGKLAVPLVTLHNTLDPVVPFDHELKYFAKTLLTGSASRFVPLPVRSYGHCNFTTEQVLFAFYLLLYLS